MKKKISFWSLILLSSFIGIVAWQSSEAVQNPNACQFRIKYLFTSPSIEMDPKDMKTSDFQSLNVSPEKFDKNVYAAMRDTMYGQYIFLKRFSMDVLYGKGVRSNRNPFETIDRSLVQKATKAVSDFETVAAEIPNLHIGCTEKKIQSKSKKKMLTVKQAPCGDISEKEALQCMVSYTESCRKYDPQLIRAGFYKGEGMKDTTLKQLQDNVNVVISRLVCLGPENNEQRALVQEFKNLHQALEQAAK